MHETTCSLPSVRNAAGSKILNRPRGSKVQMVRAKTVFGIDAFTIEGVMEF